MEGQAGWKRGRTGIIDRGLGLVQTVFLPTFPNQDLPSRIQLTADSLKLFLMQSIGRIIMVWVFKKWGYSLRNLRPLMTTTPAFIVLMPLIVRALMTPH